MLHWAYVFLLLVLAAVAMTNLATGTDHPVYWVISLAIALLGAAFILVYSWRR